MMFRAATLSVLVLALLAGCQCQLSGTPLDTMEKRLNPACWCAGWSDAAADDPPPTATTSDR